MTSEATDTTPVRARGYLPPARARLLMAVVAVCGLVTDIVTKIWAVAHLTPGQPVPLLGRVLQLHLIRNPGAAFSLGENVTIVFTILAMCVLVFVVFVLGRRVAHRGWALALGFLTAGVAGNLTDRLFRAPAPLHGHVVDFLQLPHWPIFNVADICVCTAAALIIGVSLFGRAGLDGHRDHPPPGAST